FLAASALLVLLAGAASSDDYVKDGKLTESLSVQDLQGGFAGFTGKQYTITTDGKFLEANVFNKKTTVVRKGTLTKKQITAVGKALAKYEPDKLKNTGKPTTNPHTISIAYGKNVAKLILKAGASLPKPGKKTMEGRFAGIVAAVKEALPKEKKKKKD